MKSKSTNNRRNDPPKAKPKRPGMSGGKGKIHPDAGVKFKSGGVAAGGQNPNYEKHKETKAINKFTRKVIADLFDGTYVFDKTKASTSVMKQLVAAYGEEVLQLPRGAIMTLGMIQKVILKKDVHAYNAVMNQAFGMPKQVMEGDPTKPLMQTVTRVVISPPNKPDGHS